MCTAFFVIGEAEPRGGHDASTSAPAAAPPPSLSLLLLFNRDEFLDRETAPASFWGDHPHVLAGRDLRRGGTWVGVTKTGRWALLTNFRELNFSGAGPGAPSRGVLPTDFLTGHQSPLEYLEGLVTSRSGMAAHNGFNLVVGVAGGGGGGGAAAAAAYLTNRGPPGAPGHGRPVALGSGVYGLSNGPLGRGGASHATGWVKVDAGVAALRSFMGPDGALAGPPPPSPAALPWGTLFGAGLMGCAVRAPPGALPRTGVPPEYEAALSSTFIPPTRNLFGQGKGLVYGTRSQTGVALFSDGRGVLVERSAAVAEEEDCGNPPPPSTPTPVPIAWTEVVHEFVVEAGGADGGDVVVVDEAGGCAGGPEEGEAGLVGT